GFVGRDDMLALSYGFHDQDTGHRIAAYHLYDNVDVGRTHDLHAVLTDHRLVANELFGLFNVANRNSGYFDAPACPSGNFLDVAGQYFPGAAANDAQPQQTNFYRTHLPDPCLRKNDYCSQAHLA